jgi:beta-glucanase (GH16 family)
MRNITVPGYVAASGSSTTVSRQKQTDADILALEHIGIEAGNMRRVKPDYRIDPLELRLLLSVFTFDDEFNGTVGSGPSSAWGVGNATDPNNSKVNYTNTTPAQATTSNPTTLQIVSDPLANDGKALAMSLMPNPNGSGDYLSSEITTEVDPSGAGNSIEYGHIEARIRLPGGSNSGAIWPAFWLLGDNITTVSWPACGEIDIMENDGAHPGKNDSTLHGPASGGGDYNGGAGVGSSYTLPGGADYYSAYHVFAADWGPNSITFSVDGNVFYTITPANLPAGATWPFNGHPFYMILDVCEGGVFAPGTITTTQTMYVDYVHVSAYSAVATPTLTDQDIGSPTIAGSAYFDGITHTLNASSTDVWGTSDQFNYDSQAITGNATLITQVSWVGDSGTYAKGGLMIRNGTAANASYAFVQLNPANAGGAGTGGANFEYRNGAGTAAVSAGTIAGANLANGPIWLELVRNGNVFYGYDSTNGTTWTQIGTSETIAMSSTVQAGLADSSNNPSEIGTDTFSNLSILPDAFGDMNLGNPVRIGTIGYNNSNSSWTMSGVGTGFVGSSDQFNLASGSATGDASVIANVSSQSSVNAAAMAGVMLRNTSATNSAFAAVAVTPSSGIEFLWRTTTGTTGSVVVTGKAAPIWVAITRSGNNFSGYYSTNGLVWTQIGSTQSISMGSTIQAGQAVTSGDAITTNTAVFSTVVGPTDMLNVNTGNFVVPASTAGVEGFALGGLSIGSGASVTLANGSSHASRTVLELGSLNIAGSTGAWTGKLDLGANDLIVHNGNMAQITTQIAGGYNQSGGGNWSGQGITSSAAAASTTHLTAIGVELNNDGTGHVLFGSGTSLGLFDGLSPAVTDVLAKYTYYGDSNLDGKVDGSDYSRIDSGVLNHLTGWSNGDLNYDGLINGSDYTLMDNAYNTQGASLAAQTASEIAGEIAGNSVKRMAVSFAPNVFSAGSPLADAEASQAGIELWMLKKDVVDGLSAEV